MLNKKEKDNWGAINTNDDAKSSANVDVDNNTNDMSQAFFNKHLIVMQKATWDLIHFHHEYYGEVEKIETISTRSWLVGWKMDVVHSGWNPLWWVFGSIRGPRQRWSHGDWWLRCGWSWVSASPFETK